MTKKFKNFSYVLCVIVYLVFGVGIIIYATNVMSDREYSIIATKARDLAVMVAKSYEITDSEVSEMMELDFIDVLSHPANTRLESMFGSDFQNSEIRFAYIMVKLEGDQIKYHVTEEYADFFETEPGTPLNLLWLVDVVVGSNVEDTLEEDETYYDGVKRYSYMRSDDEQIYMDRLPAYSLSDDEYGRAISGMAPIYTVEGTFVGMLGVDIYIEHYEREIEEIRNLLSYVFILPSVILTIAYIFLSIVSKKRANSTAYTDSLTSAKNRRFIDKTFPTIVKEHHKKGLPLSVIMIDVDFFKLYNDNYGHQKGDDVLVKIAASVKAALRDKTDFVCRYGGEEFFVILTNTEMSVAEKVANRIKTSVAALAIEHELSNVSDVVTISQGVYSAIPKHIDSDKDFIARADKGLYEAKHKDRDQYVLVTE